MLHKAGYWTIKSFDISIATYLRYLWWYYDDECIRIIQYSFGTFAFDFYIQQNW